MMVIVFLALLAAFLGAIALTVRGLSRNSEPMMIGGIVGMIFFALQVGGAFEVMIG